VPQRRTELDRLAAQLLRALRRETTDIIAIGKLLIACRKHLEHGEWQPWLAENFDLSLRTAHNYVAAAEYVARVSATVADFGNVAPGVLYELAAGSYYSEAEEAAILAASLKRRIDETRAGEICDALAPPDSPDEPDADDDAGDDDPEDDPDIAAILAAPPPDVPPPEPADPRNFALEDFDRTVTALMRHVTKPSAQFAGTVHSADDLEKIESFIRAVADRARKAKSPLPSRASAKPAASANALSASIRSWSDCAPSLNTARRPKWSTRRPMRCESFC